MEVYRPTVQHSAMHLSGFSSLVLPLPVLSLPFEPQATRPPGRASIKDIPQENVRSSRIGPRRDLLPSESIVAGIARGRWLPICPQYASPTDRLDPLVGDILTSRSI
jgi:hypothetical protein